MSQLLRKQIKAITANANKLTAVLPTIVIEMPQKVDENKDEIDIQPDKKVEEVRFDENSFSEPVTLFGKKIDLLPMYSKRAFGLFANKHQGGISFFENNTKTY